METRNPARRCLGGISVPCPTGAVSGNHFTHSSLKDSNSDGSRRDQFAHTILSSDDPSRSSRTRRFSRHWAAWALIELPASHPVSGFTGPTDDT